MYYLSLMRTWAAKAAIYRSTVLAFAASGLNQIFGSATNLLIGVYLVRYMVPHEFGLYNIAFAVTITTAAIGNAMFLIPMTVGIPHDDPSNRNRFMLEYISTSAICMTTVGFIISLIVMALAGLQWIKFSAAFLILSTIASCLGFFLKDAMVQAGYNQGRESATILINIASAVSIGLLIFINSISGNLVPASLAVIGYTISQFVAMAIGYALVFGRIPLPNVESLKATTVKLIGKAFWPACSSALSLLRAQAHTVVVASVIGPAGVAAINASRLVFAPVQMAQPAIVRAAMPRLVKQLRLDRRAFKRGTIAITATLGILSFTYCLLIAAIGPYIFPIVVGKAYHYSALMLTAWGLYITLVALRSGVELNQQALQRFKSLAGINIPACAMSLIGAYALTFIVGAPGAIFGLALGEVTIIGFLIVRVRADY